MNEDIADTNLQVMDIQIQKKTEGLLLTLIPISFVLHL